MNTKKRILLITTGGTIMSVQSANGLQPGEDAVYAMVSVPWVITIPS